MITAAALGSNSGTIAALAVPIVVVFAVADGYYSSLYRQTLRRSRDIEKLLGEYHNAVGIHGGREPKLGRAVAALEQHRFGVHRDMKPVNEDARWTWWIPRPLRVTWIYPILIVVASVMAVILGGDSQVGCVNGRLGQQPCVVLTTTTPGRTVTVKVPATTGTPVPQPPNRTPKAAPSPTTTSP